MISELCASALSWHTTTIHLNNSAVRWAKRYWQDLTDRRLDGIVNEAFSNDTIPHGKLNTRSLCDELETELTNVKLAHNMNSLNSLFEYNICRSIPVE